MDVTSAASNINQSTDDWTAIVGKNLFHPLDYIVFFVMLLISPVIGNYYAKRGRESAISVSVDDHLMANRKMTYGPMAISLIASFMSSVTILGVPAEFYVYGTMFAWFAIVYAIVSVLVGWVYMPVFYDLGINSTYEYLERRFNRKVRMVGTIEFLILSVIDGGIVVYGPALALSEVTGFNMWSAIFSTGLVCMFYTSLGSLKALVWTDVFQSILMITGFIAIIIQGSINFGGFMNILKVAGRGGRIDFVHFETDPRIRNTFWSIMIGGPVLWLAVNAVNQTQVQRYLCCKTKLDAKFAIILNAFGLIVIVLLAEMTGLTIYATYKECDPLDSKVITKPDQLFPYAVMDLLGSFPGIPGLFVAAIFSSSLSTLSSAMNAMACVALEDFIKPYARLDERSYAFMSKIMILVFGITIILFSLLAKNLGGLIQMAYSVQGIIGGPALALFTVGMLMPSVNETGALAGVFSGWLITIWMYFGSLAYPRRAEHLRELPRSTAGCGLKNLSTFAPTANGTTLVDGFNVTSLLDVINDGRPWIAEFYHLSYLYVAPVGFLVTVLVAILVSARTGYTLKSPPDKKLLVRLFPWEKNKGHVPLEQSTRESSQPYFIANTQTQSLKTGSNGENAQSAEGSLEVPTSERKLVPKYEATT